MTDVLMPGMGGIELAERLSKLRPQLEVLYTSGYNDSGSLPRSPTMCFAISCAVVPAMTQRCLSLHQHRTFHGSIGEILVIAHPDDQAGWLEEGTGATAQARFELPVTRIGVAADGSLA
jgi:CheY-like chemotaxis protein